MKDLVSCYGNWAMIAGAAEGIGAAFSRALAGYGFNLILVDKNYSSLNLLAEELDGKKSTKIISVQLDLSEENAINICREKMTDHECGLLIYIPAFSAVGRFTKYTSIEIDQFLVLNVRTPIHLIHSYLQMRRPGKRTGVILMSSLAGMVGPALAAPYAATKAFSLLLSESLFYEMKDSKVDILACCAGPTSTPTYWKSKPRNQSKLIEVMDPADVAAAALKKLGRTPVCIPGWKNRLIYYFLTRISVKTAGHIVSKSMLEMYPDL